MSCRTRRSCSIPRDKKGTVREFFDRLLAFTQSSPFASGSVITSQSRVARMIAEILFTTPDQGSWLDSSASRSCPLAGPPPDTSSAGLLLCQWWPMKCPYRVSSDKSGEGAPCGTLFEVDFGWCRCSRQASSICATTSRRPLFGLGGEGRCRSYRELALVPKIGSW